MLRVTKDIKTLGPSGNIRSVLGVFNIFLFFTTKRSIFPFEDSSSIVIYKRCINYAFPVKEIIHY